VLGIRNSRDDPICRVRKPPLLMRWTALTTDIECLGLAISGLIGVVLRTSASLP
jgi:hypothetical protein